MELTPGKRYRLTAETTYDAVRGGFVLDDKTLVTRISDVTDGRIKAELLPDPLPTTPGSVVRTLGGMKWLTDRGWTDERGLIVSDEFVANKVVTVLFDAGAER